MKEFLQKAKQSSRVVATLSTAIKNKTLLEFADALEENSCFIIEENIKDMKLARELDLSSAMQDRLYLNDSRIQDMANAIRQIASQTEPVGRVLDGWLTKDNLNIQKVSIPIGVIAIIYESRPNVTSDTAALCFKSGNVCVLKGGKEAENSNRAIAKIIQDVLEKNNLPKEIVSLLPDSSREGVAKLIVEDKYVDLIVPRGGEALIKFITQNSSIPVIKHDKGVCHTFIDKDANATKSINIVVNAKCQRPSACNSLETLLVHEEIASYILPGIQEELSAHGTILKGCPKTLEYIKIAPAKEEDFYIEYLENILNIKVVENLNEVDAACVYANASTRFTDGGEFGLGAEVGISTNKLHSRGPMGINDLTTFKYKIYGQGQVRTK